MATNVLFVDVDGTLLALRDGRQYVPSSALAALAETRRKGNRVYLCTGRSLAESRVIGDVPMDGVICAAGSVVMDGSTLVSEHGLGGAAVREVVLGLRERGVTFYLECDDGLYFEDAYLSFARSSWGVAGNEAWEALVHPVEEVNPERVRKLCFRSLGGTSFQQIEEEFGADFTVVRSSWDSPEAATGELSPRGVNKATAIDELLGHLALSDVRTFGFGDSLNDVAMLERCDEAIVMGGARHDISSYATYVTGAPHEDGIARAMRHFGLVCA